MQFASHDNTTTVLLLRLLVKSLRHAAELVTLRDQGVKLLASLKHTLNGLM